MGRCVLVLASVRGLVRGMVPAGAYWRLLVRVLVSGVMCGTVSLTGLFVMISHVGCWRLSEILGDCGRLQQIGRLTGKVPCCCGR